MATSVIKRVKAAQKASATRVKNFIKNSRGISRPKIKKSK